MVTYTIVRHFSWVGVFQILSISSEFARKTGHVFEPNLRCESNADEIVSSDNA